MNCQVYALTRRGNSKMTDGEQGIFIMALVKFCLRRSRSLFARFGLILVDWRIVDDCDTFVFFFCLNPSLYSAARTKKHRGGQVTYVVCLSVYGEGGKPELAGYRQQ